MPRDLRLSQLFAPVPLSRFLGQFWTKRPLIRRSKHLAKPLLSINQLGQILKRHHRSLTYGDNCRLMSGGRLVPVGEVCRQTFGRGGRVTQRIALDRVSACLSEGATLTLDSLEDYSDPVAVLVRSFSAFFRERVQANAYFTPANAQGLAAHFDTHEVIVLQMEGKKTWSLGPRFTTASNKSDRAFPSGGWRGKKIVLRPGDLLYVPRGQWHSAETMNEASLHLTLGIHCLTVFEGIETLLRQSKHVPPLSEYLFSAALGSDRRPDAARRQLAQGLEALTRAVSKATIAPEGLLSEQPFRLPTRRLRT